MYSMQHITYHAPVVLACVLLFLPVTSTLTLTKRDLPKGDISSHIPLIATRLTLDGFYKESISEFSPDDATEWQGLTSVTANSAKMRLGVHSSDTLDKKRDAGTPPLHSISLPTRKTPESGKINLGVADENVYMRVPNPVVITDSKVIRKDNGEIIDWGVFISM